MISNPPDFATDGSQSYTIDSTFRTEFTPTGSTVALSAYTGLLQYNRADANFRTDTTTRELNAYRSTHGQCPHDPYDALGNNCQTFAARIRRNLGFP